MKTNARLYVMKATDGRLKLGHSKAPFMRAKQIGKVVAVVHETDVYQHAERIERLAHRVLALQEARWCARQSTSAADEDRVHRDGIAGMVQSAGTAAQVKTRVFWITPLPLNTDFYRNS